MRWFWLTGCVLYFTAALNSWLESPLGFPHPTYAVSLIVASLALLVIAGVFLHKPCLIGMAGNLGLFLAILWVLWLAFSPVRLHSLIAENSTYGAINTFTRNYFLPNLNSEPFFESTISQASLTDQLHAAVYFLGRGWWFVLYGGLILAIGARRWQRRLLPLSVLLVLILMGVFGVGTVQSWRSEKADEAIAKGEYAEAATMFQTELNRSRLGANLPRAFLGLGEALMLQGTCRTPETLLFRGHQDYLRGRLDEAMVSYRLALVGAPERLSLVLQSFMGQLLTDSGMIMYRRADFQGATIQWERALSYDPTLMQVEFFLARASFDQGDFVRSLEINRELLKRTDNKLLNSNLQANIGDNLWELQQYQAARSAYRRSIQLDADGNMRAIKNLGGT